MINKRIENLESRIRQLEYKELEYKEVEYSDLSMALQYAIILSWSTFILFAIFIFWFAPDIDIDYDNLAYWECHNETVLYFIDTGFNTKDYTWGLSYEQDLKMNSLVLLCKQDDNCITKTKEVCEVVRR